MRSLLQSLKKRRLELGLKQNDMMLRVGVSRQQYQRLESKGNPRLETLELLAKGLNSKLMLIPQEKWSAVMAVLDSNEPQASPLSLAASERAANKSLADDPWQGLLEDDS
ncbi:MAG: transcriptional regulator [Alteromonadaceae bacterium]|nr:MAG: transcriptional regulator [Alteromonadaceae bacterium]